ncbi:MAG: PAS domain S-box protein [Bacteroidota bacterium]|nr:PAS domain S-box protein [Bacteroidota bacterium]
MPERFKALFKYATEGILVIDQSGTIIMANPSSENLFGYEEGELIGKKIELLIPSRYTRHHEQYRTKYHRNPHPRSMGIGMDLFGKRKDNSEFNVEVSLSPFETVEGEFVIAFVIDTTLRKRDEAILKKQKEELEHLTNELEKRVKDRTMILEEALHELEKSREELSASLEKEKELNELKTRFVSMASHEFRTPLATILSSLSLVKKYGEAGDITNQMRHMNRIKSSATHMTDILNDMLSISKLEEGKIVVTPESILLPDFISQVVQELQAVAKPNQHIVYRHSGDSGAFLDTKILKNILFNLGSNAIKFSPEDKPIEINTSILDGQLELRVSDHGIGIPEEDQEHLFERFYRAVNVTNIQGTGLGLNIVAKYVELMNGNITFESKINQGTSFIINIPSTFRNE